MCYSRPVVRFETKLQTLEARWSLGDLLSKTITQRVVMMLKTTATIMTLLKPRLVI